MGVGKLDEFCNFLIREETKMEFCNELKVTPNFIVQ